MAGVEATKQVELSPSIGAANRLLALLPYHWRVPAAVVISSLALTLVLFHNTAASAYWTWRTDQTYSYGILVLPIVIWLVYLRRNQVAQTHPKPAYWGLILLLPLALAWLLGNIGDVFVVQQLAVVAIMGALVVTVLGPQVARILLFPLAFMFCAAPFGDSAIPRLQDITAWFAVHALQWSGFSAVLEGRTILLPSGAWEVARACSGVRYLISATVLAMLFASFAFQRWSRRLGFVAVAALVAIVGNCVRAYVIIVLGELTSRKLATGADHTFIGWIVFLMIMAALFTAALRWREPARATDLEKSSLEERYSRPSQNVALTATAGLILLVLGLTVAAASWLRGVSTMQSTAGMTAPVATSPWAPSPQYDSGWTSSRLHAPAELAQAYGSGSRRVYLYIADYRGNRLDTFVFGGGRLLNADRWTSIADSVRRIQVQGNPVTAREVVARPIGDRAGGLRLVWSWYWVGGQFTTDPYRAKFLQAKARLLGRITNSAIVVIAADSQFDTSVAEETLQDFLLHCTFPTPQSVR